MKEERRGISSIYICVSLSYGIYIGNDMSTRITNMAGVICGLFGRAKESLSIGCVKDFPISSAKLLKLIPEGISEYTEKLDEMGYTVFGSIQVWKIIMFQMQIHLPRITVIFHMLKMSEY